MIRDTEKYVFSVLRTVFRPEPFDGLLLHCFQVWQRWATPQKTCPVVVATTFCLGRCFWSCSIENLPLNLNTWDAWVPAGSLQSPFSRWMANPTLVCPYHGTQLNNQCLHMQQKPGWIFREWCWVDKAHPKTLHSVSFHLYHILEMTKWLKWRPDQWLPEVEEGIRAGEKWMWLQKGSLRDHCVDGNVLTFNVNLLVVVLY